MLPKIRKIVYATGMGAGAPYVFRYALSLARQHEAEIIAVSALEPLSSFAQNLVSVYIPENQQEVLHEEAHQHAKDKLQQRIAQLCEKECGDDPHCQQRLIEIRIEDAQPAQAVLSVAEEVDADLIIMGSHRHTVVGDALLGTTTHKVLHSSSVPVLVIRIPEGYHEEGF